MSRTIQTSRIPDDERCILATAFCNLEFNQLLEKHLVRIVCLLGYHTILMNSIKHSLSLDYNTMMILVGTLSEKTSKR